MKKQFFCIVLLLLFLPVLSFPAEAADETAEALPPELQEGYETMLDAIPDGVRDQLPDDFTSENGEGLSSAIGEMLEPSYLAAVILEALGVYLDDALRLLASLFGILILSAVFSAVRRSVKSSALGRVVTLVASCAILAAIADTQTKLFSQLSDYFSQLSVLAGGMIPVSGVLYAMGGNVAGAATGGAAMSIFLAISEFVGGELLFPTVGACLALACVPVFAPGLNVRSLSACIKKTFTFCLGFLMMMMSALLALRSGLAMKADSISARTVKYVASSVIPVVGGSIADSLRTVGASVEYLRTTVGVAGILLVVLLLVPVLVNVLVTRFCLILAESTAEVLGCDGEARLLSELVSVYGYILAVAVMCAVMFIFALTILTRTAAAIG
ncbi:MAG: hypothetical protein IKC26_10800 [Clostridia bacterium]|nr:hypothetical protein [Clostridia bacterium]MBR2908513.1 hypothetical protein [Clostridia bacterium]